MKKSASARCFFLFLLMVFAACTTTTANTGRPQYLDFGSVAPVTQVSRTLPFIIPATPAPTVRFESSGLIMARTGNRIPAERLTLALGKTTSGLNQQVTLPTGSAPTTVNGNYLAFQLTIQLLPSDPPGEYEGTINVVYPETESPGPMPITVKIRILPWVRIKPISPDAVLTIKESPFLTEDNLPAIAPVKLLLASNAPWRLLLRIEEQTLFNAPPFPLQARIGKTLKTTDFHGRILPGDDYRPVAFGQATVVGDGSTPKNYWTELFFTVSVPNWHHYPTGDYRFRLLFAAETITP